MSKRIIISGASSGIGNAFGEYFKSINWKVINISRSSSEFKNYKLDLSNINNLEEFLSIVEKEHPNIIIFNCGILQNKWVGEYTKDEIIHATNLNSIIPIILLNKLINTKIKLVFISSIASRIIPTVQSLYGATKSYLSSVVQAAQAEQLYSSKKTNIVEVIPGKFLSTNINPIIKNMDKLHYQFLKKEIKLVSEKILNGDMTIWTHADFYKKIVERSFKNPINEAMNSINYRMKKDIISDR